ncbi:MAG: hypothetical protein ACR2PS_11170, partial [Pseudomonadales bacterium]
LEVSLRFTNSAVTKASLEEFVDLERQCCGFLSFDISETREHLTLRINGPDGSEDVLQMFVKTAREQ